MARQLSHAGRWFLRSGIQEPTGGVARYYRADLEINHPVSTEITGYTVSALVYLHELMPDSTGQYLERAVAGAQFLARQAWDPASGAMPFETGTPAFSYFFDCGIIVRGLLAVWRATGSQEFLDAAVAVGESMVADFASDGADFHPILALPSKLPIARDTLRWSRSAGCYQLKSAMALWDLFEATGEARFNVAYEQVLAYSLQTYKDFLPGHPDPLKVMDRLHAFLYFLEGLMPRAATAGGAAALAEGIRRVQGHVSRIAPEFERSDVYAQLLRVRIYAAGAGIVPLDAAAAAVEAKRLAEFQVAASDPRVDGGFYFGHKNGAWLPHVNPVSTAFAAQALALWETRENGAHQPWRLLI